MATFWRDSISGLDETVLPLHRREAPINLQSGLRFMLHPLQSRVLFLLEIQKLVRHPIVMINVCKDNIQYNTIVEQHFR
jgi:hypothetical protein